jgi:PAS domain S-box-containing protein
LADNRDFPESTSETVAHIKRESSFWSVEDAFRLLVESLKDYALFMMEPDGRIVSWSLGVERILGYGESEFLDLPFASIFTPEDRVDGADQREMGCAIRTGRAEDERWHLRQDETRVWVSGVLTALYDQNGTLRGFAKVMRDHTEARSLLERERAARQQADQALQTAEKALQAAEAADHAKDEFMAVISHELRTPLNIVSGWISLLREGNLDPAMQEQALETIERNMQAQARLVNDLLDVTRIREGKIHLEIAPLNIASLLQSVVDGIHPTALAKTIHLELAECPSPVYISADRDRIQQVISNLLSNAVKFTPESGSIEVALRCVAERVRITIRDSGVGISPEFLPQVFDRFRQAPANDNGQGGLGLGLAIALHLVEMHGGTLSADSEGVGQGATFTIELPLMKTDTGVNAE